MCGGRQRAGSSRNQRVPPAQALPPQLTAPSESATCHPPLQSAREKASNEFRTARSAILFSSDVSARGVDYPDVTLVLQVRGLGGCWRVGACGPRRVGRALVPDSTTILTPPAPPPAPTPPACPQVGVPSSREQYIHRLGRTARAGRAGRGVLLLMPEEQHFLRQLKGEGCSYACLSLAPLAAAPSARPVPGTSRSSAQFPHLAPPRPAHPTPDLPLTAEPGVPTTPQDAAAVAAALPRVGDRLPDMVGGLRQDSRDARALCSGGTCGAASAHGLQCAVPTPSPPHPRLPPAAGLRCLARLLQLGQGYGLGQAHTRAAGQPLCGRDGPSRAARAAEEDHRHDGAPVGWGAVVGAGWRVCVEAA